MDKSDLNENLIDFSDNHSDNKNNEISNIIFNQQMEELVLK